MLRKMPLGNARFEQLGEYVRSAFHDEVIITSSGPTQLDNIEPKGNEHNDLLFRKRWWLMEIPMNYVK